MSGNIQEPHNEHINRYKMAHMVGVAEYMRERAEDYNLNPDEMYAVGLLHDIGYIGGRQGHEQYGAEIMENLGMDMDVIFAIRHHGENMKEVAAKYGKDNLYPLYVLTVEADMSVDATGHRVGFEGRMEDIKRRYGEDHIAYATVKDNIEFIKEWQKEHGIGKPTQLYHKSSEKHNSHRHNHSNKQYVSME